MDLRQILPSWILLDERPEYFLNEMAALSNESGVVTCDFTIKNIEKCLSIFGGFRYHKIYNIDHHFPGASNFLTSTEQAAKFVQAYGQFDSVYPIAINHVDADSVLASLILKGCLKPDEAYIKAAIAADHTGEENEIADLLNGLTYLRSPYESCLNLELLLNKQPLEANGQDALIKRHAKRKEAQNIAQNASWVGNIAYTKRNFAFDTALLRPHLAKASLIVVFHRQGNKTKVYIRTGKNAPPELDLLKLNIQKFDPIFGGRTGAGSNSRGGGTHLPINEYLANLELCLVQYQTPKIT